MGVFEKKVDYKITNNHKTYYKTPSFFLFFGTFSVLLSISEETSKHTKSLVIVSKKDLDFKTIIFNKTLQCIFFKRRKNIVFISVISGLTTLFLNAIYMSPKDIEKGQATRKN